MINVTLDIALGEDLDADEARAHAEMISDMILDKYKNVAISYTVEES
jgi:hypothetical protein